ncbi:MULTISPECIES: hypothetical protein [Paenibacillus]|uniref:Uncharacterized protein n=1 Tax=Paenibacillus oleatilyticus TaxID=2594886 RepID=A0ABV4V0D3_9BACL|nr:MULTISPECIES: hypothetical protein [Paenibacillus]MBU7317127.1 hypothetical protein [Paenibacillus oleatilyticus]MCP1312013.1 hypothetical protein [Paenibacillus tyrfis]
MRNRNSTVAYVIFGLIAIGILASVLSNPGTFIIPILVFGVIFFLYKFPPNRWRQPKRPSSSRFQKGKRRNATFRVIQGSKDSSDEPPKYH